MLGPRLIWWDDLFHRNATCGCWNQELFWFKLMWAADIMTGDEVMVSLFRMCGWVFTPSCRSGAGGDAAAALPDPADDALPPMVAGTFTPPPSSVAASPTLSQRNSEIQVGRGWGSDGRIVVGCGGCYQVWFPRIIIESDGFNDVSVYFERLPGFRCFPMAQHTSETCRRGKPAWGEGPMYPRA